MVREEDQPAVLSLDQPQSLLKKWRRKTDQQADQKEEEEDEEEKEELVDLPRLPGICQVTVEDPAEVFQKLRDRVDVKRTLSWLLKPNTPPFIPSNNISALSPLIDSISQVSVLSYFSN